MAFDGFPVDARSGMPEARDYILAAWSCCEVGSTTWDGTNIVDADGMANTVKISH